VNDQRLLKVFFGESRLFERLGVNNEGRSLNVFFRERKFRRLRLQRGKKIGCFMRTIANDDRFSGLDGVNGASSCAVQTWTLFQHPRSNAPTPKPVASVGTIGWTERWASDVFHDLTRLNGLRMPSKRGMSKVVSLHGDGSLVGAV